MTAAKLAQAAQGGSMTDQLALDLGPMVEPDTERDATIAERFEAFHRANPWVFAALVRLARDARDRGRRYGIKALYERLRWEYDANTIGEQFALNNDFTSRYSRLIEANCPDLAGYFRTRELRAA